MTDTELWSIKEVANAFKKHGIIQDQEPSGDLISRDMALEKMADYVASGYADSVEDFEEYSRIICQLPFVNPQEPKWIPVSERFPEKNMACLVAVGKFNFTQMAMYSDLMGTIDHRIFYQGDYGHENFVDITQYVIAWMPLPKPYEPQESEDKE